MKPNTQQNNFKELEKIKALCITADQENGKAVIKPQIQSIILKYKNDQRFIFAVGRELEFKGNIIDGLALMSLIELTLYEDALQNATKTIN